nr:MAG TPA: PROTEIN/RNA Complex.7A [Bacteriophage sp.]
MIESDVIRKISDLNNDNRDWQSLEQIENKIIKAATKGYTRIKVGAIGDYAANILKDNGYFFI